MKDITGGHQDTIPSNVSHKQFQDKGLTNFRSGLGIQSD
jgi:hypothetical protein